MNRRHATAACLRLLRHQRTLMGDCAGSAGAKRRERRLSPDNNLFPPHLLADIARAAATPRVAKATFRVADMSRLAAFSEALQAYAAAHPASVAPENPWLTRQACAAILREARCSHFAEEDPLLARLLQAATRSQAHAARQARRTLRETLRPFPPQSPLLVAQGALESLLGRLEWLDTDLLAEAMLAAHAAGALAARQRSRHTPAKPGRFAESEPEWVLYRDALESWRRKRAINGREMQDMLDALAAGGSVPDPDRLRQDLYANAFTMVREGNQHVLDRIRMRTDTLIQQGFTVGDYLHDINDIYRAAGVDDQQFWYLELVHNNNMRRAYAEGQDLVAQEMDADGTLWGYRYRHSGKDDYRPTHKALDGLALRKDDPRVQQIGYPKPPGHNCGCEWDTVSTDEAEVGRYDPDPPTPAVSPEDLAKLPPGYRDGLTDQELAQGIDALEALDRLPNQRFPRSEYNIPNRPIFNPSFGRRLAGIDYPLDQAIEDNMRREGSRLLGQGRGRVEKAAVIDRTNRVTVQKLTGASDRIDIDHLPDDLLRDAAFVHYHPDDAQDPAGGLSPQDVLTAARRNMAAIASVHRQRATGRRYIDIVRRPAQGWPENLALSEALAPENIKAALNARHQERAFLAKRTNSRDAFTTTLRKVLVDKLNPLGVKYSVERLED